MRPYKTCASFRPFHCVVYEKTVLNFCPRMTEIHVGNYFNNLLKTISPETELFQVMLDAIINCTPRRPKFNVNTVIQPILYSV